MNAPQEFYIEIEPRSGYRAEDYRPIFQGDTLMGISIFYYPIEEPALSPYAPIDEGVIPFLPDPNEHPQEGLHATP